MWPGSTASRVITFCLRLLLPHQFPLLPTHPSRHVMPHPNSPRATPHHAHPACLGQLDRPTAEVAVRPGKQEGGHAVPVLPQRYPAPWVVATNQGAAS